MISQTRTVIVGHVLLALLALLLALPAFAHSEKTQIDLGDRIVRGLIDHPSGEGPFPFLIVAVSDDAEAKSAFYEKLVAGAVKEGFVTLRLDWSFKTSKTAQTADVKREAEELGIVVTELTSSRMMKQYEIDPTKVALVAKGYGAKVAMNPDAGAFGDKVKAVALLNPVCDLAAGSFSEIYAPFAAAKTPRLLVAERGAGCALAQIYAAAKDFGEDVSLVSGDVNADAASVATLHWLRSRGWAAAKKSVPKKLNAKKHAHDAQSAGTHP